MLFIIRSLLIKNTKIPVNFSGECSYSFNLLRCAIEDVNELKEIWKKYDDGAVDLMVLI